MNKKYLRSAVYSVIGALLICGCTQKSKNTTDSPKGFELEAVDTLHILEVGEKPLMQNYSTCKATSIICLKPSQMVAMCCSTSGIFTAARADKPESELLEVYERMKGKLEIVAINLDSISEWQGHEWSKKIVWKNWNDGKKFKKEVSRAAITTSMPYLSTSYCRPMAIFFGRWLVMA